eukprot:2438726-Amphidinium_carterae.1
MVAVKRLDQTFYLENESRSHAPIACTSGSVLVWASQLCLQTTEREHPQWLNAPSCELQPRPLPD